MASMAGRTDMDERTVRLHLEEVRSAMKRNEEEREVLVTLVKGYEGWLRLHGTSAPPPVPGQLPLGHNGHGDGAIPRNRTLGTVGWKESVSAVLKEAAGAPIHAKEIWLRAHAKGLMTTSKDPVSAVELTAIHIPEAKKLGKRMWQWVGTNI